MLRRTLLQGLAGGAALAAAPGAFAQQSKPGRWLRQESPNFIAYSPASEDKGREELIALERFNALLARLMPRQERSPLKLSVYVAGSARDFDQTRPGIGKFAAGFYDSSIEHIRAVTAPYQATQRQRNMKQNIRASDARVLLFHEYTHHFVFANNRRSYPRWYVEGIAEFASTADLTDNGIRLGMFTQDRAEWLLYGDWLGIEKFLRGQTKDSEDTAMFYAQAWLATHYLMLDPERSKGFDRYCLALQAGGDPIGVFQTSFGISPDQFDKELRDYKKKPIKILTLHEDKADQAPGITTQRLGAAMDDILMPLCFLRVVPPKKNATDTIARVRESALKHPEDPAALNALTFAEVWYGDLAQAKTFVETLLKLEGGNPETHHLKGLCDIRTAYKTNDQELFKSARGAFAAAYKLDASRASSLFRYVEASLSIEGTMTEHMTDALVDAWRIAPQVEVLSLMTAQALIQHKRWEEAVLILRPLTASIHNQRTAERAAPYLEAAMAHKEAPLTIFAAADKMDLDYE